MTTSPSKVDPTQWSITGAENGFIVTVSDISNPNVQTKTYVFETFESLGHFLKLELDGPF